MHSYYVSKSKSEVDHKQTEQEIKNKVAQASLPFDNENSDDDYEFDEEWIEEEDDDEKLNTTQINSNNVKFIELVDINDPVFCHALETNVRVEIPAPTEEIEDDLDFDINSLVETAMSKRLAQTHD